MSVNKMTVGRDYSFGFYDQNTGGLIDLGSVQMVKVSQPAHRIENRPYNGDPSFGYIPDGYRFAFTITRTSNQLEDYMLNLIERFRAGQSIQPGFLNESITDDNGTVRYQYEGFTFWITDLGDISREGVVKITAEGAASHKRKIA